MEDEGMNVNDVDMENEDAEEIEVVIDEEIQETLNHLSDNSDELLRIALLYESNSTSSDLSEAENLIESVDNNVLIIMLLSILVVFNVIRGLK